MINIYINNCTFQNFMVKLCVHKPVMLKTITMFD